MCVSIIRIRFNLIISNVHKEIIAFTDEKLKPKFQIKDEFIYIMNYSVRPHFNSVFDLQIDNSFHLFVLNFVIRGKVTSLPKVIKYVKRNNYSFHDFSAKHTPRSTLMRFVSGQ